MIWGWMLSSYFLYHTVTNIQPRGWHASPFWVLWLGPTIHLPFTVGYHQFLCISDLHLRYWRSLDVIFIFAASTCFAYAFAYFVFPFWLTLLVLVVALGLTGLAWHVAHHLPAGAEIQKSKNTGFVGLIVSVYLTPLVAQAFSAAFLEGRVWDTDVQMVVGAFGSLVFSAVVYVKSIPDVWCPGTFDFVGSAQQWMHLGVSAAHFFEWYFLFFMYDRVLLQEEMTRV
eukprot:CAMPEP_0175076584 /NCGR_PEP_ID=MMETSP0052_2-20121109/22819_1 /TAXON_ID=51329 ORGANISM="Polytomella parva, Strain SAG 63-3" /NCGR_SAMPLE_ID=MMETSP0052_2 /ASSEMBLY_ACC=CAM_ASM_000194 /LENGTH=226 /DNA_ID=CAMNT_0016345761 /DNA_START=239 /DNA_END=919 /DNA_ORIENTATION=+